MAFAGSSFTATLHNNNHITSSSNTNTNVTTKQQQQKPYSQSHRHRAAMSAAQSVPFHCIICFDKFNQTTRYPVVLPCGHTYVCAECASRLTKCMECRAPFKKLLPKPPQFGGPPGNSASAGSPHLQPRHPPHTQQYRHSPNNPYHSSPNLRPKLVEAIDDGPVQHPKNIVLLSLLEAAERSKSIRDKIMEYDDEDDDDDVDADDEGEDDDDDDRDHDFQEHDHEENNNNNAHQSQHSHAISHSNTEEDSIHITPNASGLSSQSSKIGEPLRRVPPNDNDSCQSSLLDISREQDELDEDNENDNKDVSSSSDEDEDDEMNRIIMGIEALSGPSGTYAVKDPKGLAVLPTHPRIQRKLFLDQKSTTQDSYHDVSMVDKEEKQQDSTITTPTTTTTTTTTVVVTIDDSATEEKEIVVVEKDTQHEHEHEHDMEEAAIKNEQQQRLQVENTDDEEDEESKLHQEDENEDQDEKKTKEEEPIGRASSSSPAVPQEPFMIEQGQTLQVVHYNSKEGIAKLARNRGYIVASSTQLVKVNGPLDKACQLEGMLELVDVRKQELITKLEELQELQTGLQVQLTKCLQEEPTHPIIGNPPCLTTTDDAGTNNDENHHASFGRLNTSSPSHHYSPPYMSQSASPIRTTSHHDPSPSTPQPHHHSPHTTPNHPTSAVSTQSLPPSLPFTGGHGNNNNNNTHDSARSSPKFDQEEKYDEEHVGLGGSGGFPVVQLHVDDTPNATGIEVSTPPRSHRVFSLSPNTIDNADLCMNFHPHHFVLGDSDGENENVPFAHSMEEGICNYPIIGRGTAAATPTATLQNGAPTTTTSTSSPEPGTTTGNNPATTTTTTTNLPRPDSSSLFDQYGGGCGPSFFLTQSSPFGGGDDEEAEALVGLSIDTSSRNNQQHHLLDDDDEGHNTSKKSNNIHRQVMNSGTVGTASSNNGNPAPRPTHNRSRSSSSHEYNATAAGAPSASRSTASGRPASTSPNVSPTHGGGGGVLSGFSGHHLFSSSLYAYHSGGASVPGGTTNSFSTNTNVPHEPYLSSAGRSSSHSTGGSFDSVDFRTGMSGHRGALLTRTSERSRQRAFQYRNVRLMGEHRGVGRPPGPIPRSQSHY